MFSFMVIDFTERGLMMRYLFSGKQKVELKPAGDSDCGNLRRMAIDSFDVSLDWKDVEEVDGVAWFRDVSLSKEMVQDYGDVKVLKCADELGAAVPFLNLRPVTKDHPAEGIVTCRDEICGHVENSKMSDGELVGDLAITCDTLKEEIKSGARRDVSIGFHADWDLTPGVLGDVAYDAIQRNILIDHVAVVERGKCSVSDGCGITMEVLSVDAEGTVSGTLTTGADSEVSQDALNLKWIVEYAVERLMDRYVEGKVLEGALTPLFAQANEVIAGVVGEAITGLQEDTVKREKARDGEALALKKMVEDLAVSVSPHFAVGDDRSEGRSAVNEAYAKASNR